MGIQPVGAGGRNRRVLRAEGPSGASSAGGGATWQPSPPSPGMPAHRYMPQGLSGTTSPPLTVNENVDFFARLFGLGRAERRSRRRCLCWSGTGLGGLQVPARRPAFRGDEAENSGCAAALIHAPGPGYLDESTTGVDPFSPPPVLGPDRQHPLRSPDHDRAGGTGPRWTSASFDWLVARWTGGRVLSAAPRGTAPAHRPPAQRRPSSLPALPEGEAPGSTIRSRCHRAAGVDRPAGDRGH